MQPNVGRFAVLHIPSILPTHLKQRIRDLPKRAHAHRIPLRVAQKLSEHCTRKGVALSHFATAWVLAHRAVSSVIAGPRTFEQWKEYVFALDCEITPEDEAFVDSLVSPGHPSTPGYNDPPIRGRRRS